MTIATLLIIAVRREKTNILFALSLLILPYLPASNLFFPVGFVVAERILYLPSMGFCMLVAIVCQELMNRGKKWTRLIKPVLLFILLIQSLKVIQRNRDWYSEDVLWKSAVSVNPNNSKVFTNLAKSYEVSDRELALSLAEHALQLQPNVMVQWINVAMLHKSQGRHLKAEEVLKDALLYFTVKQEALYMYLCMNYPLFSSFLDNFLHFGLDHSGSLPFSYFYYFLCILVKEVKIEACVIHSTCVELWHWYPRARRWQSTWAVVLLMCTERWQISSNTTAVVWKKPSCSSAKQHHWK